MSLQAAQSEKRQFKRFSFDSSVKLEKDGQRWESTLLDISLKGVLITKPDNWNETGADDYKLSIHLDNSDVVINMDVKPAHAENEHLGFHCEQIDLDSVTSLRRLVELNLADEDLLEREISNMVSV